MLDCTPDVHTWASAFLQQCRPMQVQQGSLKGTAHASGADKAFWVPIGPFGLAHQLGSLMGKLVGACLQHVLLLEVGQA